VIGMQIGDSDSRQSCVVASWRTAATCTGMHSLNDTLARSAHKFGLACEAPGQNDTVRSGTDSLGMRAGRGMPAGLKPNARGWLCMALATVRFGAVGRDGNGLGSCRIKQISIHQHIGDG
jgi:hypothetical protein